MHSDIPKEAVDFLRVAATLRTPALRINPLSPEQAAAETASLLTIPIATTLGLVVLDDADDSNPYCLITRGLARGVVVHFSHDPEPTLAFESLSAFREALSSAIRDRRTIDDLERSPLTPLRDQAGLRSALQALLTSDDEDAATLLTLFLPLLDPSDSGTVHHAASNVDFVIREAAALFIKHHPLSHFGAIAQALADDPYPQVARPAREALQLIRGSGGQHAG